MTVGVFICGDEPRISAASTDVQVVAGLCRDPKALREQAVDFDRAVLLLHHDQYDLPLVQSALRGADIDPMGAQFVDVAGGANPIPGTHINGLVRRAEAFVGTTPDHLKPVAPTARSRRAFLRPPTMETVSVPAIDHLSCAAGSGCRACVETCPENAYRWDAGRLSFDKAACVSCGRCVTTCPTGAIENPALTPTMVHAQVRAVLKGSDGSLGIRFVCSRGTMDADASWSDIAVPCTSMVPASWLVACRLLGAACAKAVPCSTAGCPLGHDEVVARQNDLAGAIMRASGVDVLSTLASSDFREGDNLFEKSAAARSMVQLSAIAGQDVLVVDDAAELGAVTIEPDTCTLCGQCAKVCPTNALRESYDGDAVSITFDPAHCVNCVQCMNECPELARSAIRVNGCIDTSALQVGRLTLNSGTLAVCTICGAAIAPSPMMDRISKLLGDEFSDTMTVLANQCIDCRGR